MFFNLITMSVVKKFFFIAGIILIVFFSPRIIFAQSPLFLIPPTEFMAFDTPNDAGETVSLTWPASPNDAPDVFYVIYIDKDKNGAFEKEAIRIKSNTSYRTSVPEIYGYKKRNGDYHYVQIIPRKVFNEETLDKKQVYYFKLAMVAGDTKITLDTIASASARGNWLHTKKINNFVIMIILSAIILYFIVHARRNPNMFLRKISGLDAVDEALGRATEMGKPVLFVHGLTGMGSISTIAAISILGRIARKIADYDANLKVVNNDPIVMSVSQEVVKESYLEAGRPDAYNSDNVFLVASEQFPYVAAVGGIMTREKPAANFFVGYFYAEALILAETGASTGAIQIAGTDAYTQLPFFITTCDYTLIGEELYAASAYLSREPMLMGTLRAQDVGKGLLIIILLLGTLLASFGVTYITHLFEAF
ncbi:MAG: hypothetical protein DYG83_11860 [Candidatus Brocadia sp. AMX2]|nr:MAG: hypothetical protein EDM70_11220 [Candidatus Brocadia sp. AMX2]KXK30283.1 MAG: hypothetical protein UZ01_01421 [Candidatus Brocadia sinica]MBC6933191.1 hypothetical protein [Candidatus Brocadia sp.]MBL1169618.1 hypothetical protein [Candidatus Brocadia sp. AMX1]NOG40861.1 hypothetical protein [Planctomycetota bacterium]